MDKIRRTKVTNAGHRGAPIEAVPNGKAIVATSANSAGDIAPLSEPARHWQRENRAAIECYNEWLAEHGLPLEEFRRF